MACARPHATTVAPLLRTLPARLEGSIAHAGRAYQARPANPPTRQPANSWGCGAAAEPLLVIDEDLHWSDDTGLDFLLHLARRLAGHLLLLTYGDDAIHPGLTHVLTSLDRERLTTELALTRLPVVHALLPTRAGAPRQGVELAVQAA